MSPLPLIALTLTGLATIEGLAWWWMNPPAAGNGEPVLAYRPQVGLDRRAGPLVASGAESQGTEEERSQETGVKGQKTANSTAQSSSLNPQSTIHNQQSEISPSSSDHSSSSPSPTDHRSLLTDSSRHSPAATADHSSSASSNQKSTIVNPQSSISSSSTPLPEIYRQAAPMLRCTSGQVFHLKIHDTAGLHGAFFEWDGTDTGSVLEAFRHMPEACMGSIGMKLVSKEKPILYVVRGQESGDRSQESANASVQSASSHSTSNIQNSKSATQSLTFDHTVFRDPGQGGGPLVPGPLVHAFRAVWVAGMENADARSGLDGRGFDQLRAIRLKAALTRYRPRHARVIQGAVRGFHTPEAAWAAFEQHMLRNLAFER